MKISFSLRAFVVYFVILAALSWFFLDEAVERLNVALRQSAESVLVDTANLLATSLESQFEDDTVDTWEIQRLFTQAYQRELNAKIYQLSKNKIDTEVYVTNGEGVVVYDSSGEHTGDDFSRWRDVRLTLAGEYGARTSFRYDDKTEKDDPKIMVVAAPVRFQEKIVGVVSVVKPVDTLELFLLDQSALLKRYAIGLLALAMLLGYIVSHGFTAATNKLARYANDMAAGKKVPKPDFMDKRFANLSNAITNMREQIDGKEYVENYVHSLTHELKTPVTSIQASAELLGENIPTADREKFIRNIQTSNRRMSQLVDRMLSLAKLEGTPQITFSEFDLALSLQTLVEERSATIQEKDIHLSMSSDKTLNVNGDPLLIQQAAANLLDNALAFSARSGKIKISCESQNNGYLIKIFNQGRALDDFVLKRAFDRFFSVPPTQSDTKSTGLGLSFVREIMRLHQGDANLANTSDGIVATLWWPRPDPG